MKLMAVEYQ